RRERLKFCAHPIGRLVREEPEVEEQLASAGVEILNQIARRGIGVRRCRTQSLRKLVAKNRYGESEVHRRTISRGTDGCRALTERDLRSAQSPLFAAKHQGERVLIAERLFGEPRDFDRGELLIDVARANCSRGNAEMNV